MELLLEGLRGAAEPTRLRLLAVLAQSELTVSELTQISGLSQPRISRHLKLMCAAGLIDRFKEGAWVFYRLADQGEGGKLAHTLVSLLDAHDPELARDFVRLTDIRAARAQEAEEYFRRNAAQWDEIRSLYVSDSDVERALRDMVNVGDANANKRIGTFVDFGTGTGRIIEILGPYADVNLGLDVNREMLAIARTNLERSELTNWQIRQSDILSVPLADESADLVTVHQVLHYLSEPERVISEAARILKPQGRLLIVDFAPHDLEFLRAEHAHRRLGFATDEVTSWCRNAGLKLIETRELAPSQRGLGEKLTVVLWLAQKQGGRQ